MSGSGGRWLEFASWRKVRAGQGAAAVNGCHFAGFKSCEGGIAPQKIHSPHVLLSQDSSGGEGEKVRQERTASPVTVMAGQAPPPARPNMLKPGPGINSG